MNIKRKKNIENYIKQYIIYLLKFDSLELSLVFWDLDSLIKHLSISNGTDVRPVTALPSTSVRECCANTKSKRAVRTRDVDMDVTSLKTKRRGNETKNIPTEYFCPKCDHTEYGND